MGARCSSLRFSWRKLDHEGGLIIDDHAAVAVENLAAGSQQRNGLDAIALGRVLLAS